MRKLSTKSKVSIFVLIIFVFAVMFVSAKFVFPKGIVENKDAEGEQVILNNLDKISQDKVNFLLLGTDASGQRTDTMLFISFDKKNEIINMVSIPRDTRILIGERFYKINSCIPYGKEELLFKTIRDITGAPINYYAKVNFEGFKNIVDILGGVDFYVPENMKYSDPGQKLYIDLKKGQQHLDGTKAVQLVRYRGYAEADLQRIKVQQDFIKELIEQKMTAENILKAPSIYNEAVKHIKTNFTIGDLLGNMNIIKVFGEQKEGSILNFTMPGIAMMINGASYYIHDPIKTLELFKENFGGSGTSNMSSTYIKLNSKAKPDTFEAANNNKNEISEFEDEPTEDTRADVTDKGYSEDIETSYQNKETNFENETSKDKGTDITQSSIPDWLKE